MLLEAETISQLMPRPLRPLSDGILAAFHQACDQGEHAIAADLLGVAAKLVRHGALSGDFGRSVRDQAFEAARDRLQTLTRAAADPAGPTPG
jgi:hypothetical protein